jgi:hypothetical protein
VCKTFDRATNQFDKKCEPAAAPTKISHGSCNSLTYLAAKAQAAAVRLVGSGTAGAVTADITGTGFETTVTKSDGSKVEVHLDRPYNAFQGPGS